MNTLFDQIVGRLEESNHVIEDTGVMRMYDTGAIYTQLPDFTEELMQEFPFAEYVAYRTNLSLHYTSIDVGVSYDDKLFLFLFRPELWEKGEPAEMTVVEMDLFDLFEHLPVDELPPKLIAVIEYVKTAIEHMKKYRLHAVTGKGWRWS